MRIVEDEFAFPVLTNQPKQTEDASENLNNENLDEQVWIRSISEGGRRASDSDTNTAEQVACTHGDTTPEDGET